MSTRTVRRSISSVRRSPAPRRSQMSGGLAGAFSGMLARLTFAGEQLQRAKPRARR